MPATCAPQHLDVLLVDFEDDVGECLAYSRYSGPPRVNCCGGQDYGINRVCVNWRRHRVWFFEQKSCWHGGGCGTDDLNKKLASENHAFELSSCFCVVIEVASLDLVCDHLDIGRQV